ncbi:MAG: hypothetical protein AAF415_13370 [Pseudomonadota bacterium]
MSDLGLICFVALDDWQPVEAPALRQALSYSAPNSSITLTPRDSEDAILVSIDRQEFLVASMQGQIPEPEYSQAMRNSLFWPDAGAEMAQHTAFVAIAAVAPEDAHGLVRAQAVALTRLAAAVAEAAPSLGVYWRGAEGAVPPGRLLSAPSEIAAGKWPVDIWIGYVFYGQDTGQHPMIGVQTRGAEAYLGFEIEVPPITVASGDRKEPLRILFGAVGYLMAQGAQIRNGQQVQVAGERRTTWQLHTATGGGPGLAQLTAVEG